MSPNLKNKICLVTGATRGIGRGIALQLGQAGATVYITGRTKEKLDSCAEEINQRGGKSIPLIVDHGKDEEVENLFKTIKSEQNGKLDLLVNNAYNAVDLIMKKNESKTPFFKVENPSQYWDLVNNVGLRNHFLCTYYSSQIMTENMSGLIVNVSSIGGLMYLFDPVYGMGKAACDRMATDCAVELKKSNVAMISLWPGAVRTETITDNINQTSGDAKERFEKTFAGAESLEFAGKAVAHLAADEKIMKKSGKIHLTADLAYEYGFKEKDGTVPDFRQLNQALRHVGLEFLAQFVPNFIRVPLIVFHMMGYKFAIRY